MVDRYSTHRSCTIFRKCAISQMLDYGIFISYHKKGDKTHFWEYTHILKKYTQRWLKLFYYDLFNIKFSSFQSFIPGKNRGVYIFREDLSHDTQLCHAALFDLYLVEMFCIPSRQFKISFRQFSYMIFR